MAEGYVTSVKAESDLSALIREYGLTITPSGSYKDRWVAYNHGATGRGATPDEAVYEAVSRLEGTKKPA